MKKVAFSIVLGIMLIAIMGFVVAADSSSNGTPLVGNDRDSHGCIPSAGYTWCADLNRCIRSWEVNCTQRADLRQNLIDKVNTRLGTNFTITDIGTGAIRVELKDYLREHNQRLWLNVTNRNISVQEISQGRLDIITDKINAKTGLNLSTEDVENGTALKALLSNGRWADVKIMPDAASATALAVLGAKCAERNCTVELKEVGKAGTNQTKLAYEVSTEKDSKVLFLFPGKMKVVAQVDAETGQVISEKRPWWAFLASQKNESISSETNITS